MVPPKNSLSHYEFWTPVGTTWLRALLNHLNIFFDRFYSSKFNPLYRTGLLATLFLSFTVITGVYLIFFYSIHSPYESMVRIQENVFFTRWVRSFHRYASDAAALAMVMHFLRVFVQGKTWGPRMLAWVTGVLLVIMMAICAWTGFVMMWDEHGQALAIIGAKVLRAIPIFQEPPDRIFVGERPLNSQFFFLNIFIHMALPLAMIGFLWLHTSRLARPGWFPEKKIIWCTTLALFALSVLWPAPLAPSGNLLSIPGRVPANWFYNFWLPWAKSGPGVFLILTILFFAIVISMPWWCRPGKSKRPPPSYVDPNHCEGCQQCYLDCPFDAIEMVPGINPEKYPLRANILPQLCVSCGICAGSCSTLAIGPKYRTAKEQFTEAKKLVHGMRGGPEKRILIACANNRGLLQKIKTSYGQDSELELVQVGCTGTLHPGAVQYLANHSTGLMIVGCATHDCIHREGSGILEDRVLNGRNPAILDKMPLGKIATVHQSMGEWKNIKFAVENWRAGGSQGATRTVAVWWTWLKGTLITGGLLSLLALGSSWPQGDIIDHSMLRLGFRLTGQVKETCEDLSAEAMAKLPMHMRTARKCKLEVLTYLLKATLDGRVLIEKRVTPAGLRGDRPLSVEEDFEVTTGEHTVEVSFVPEVEGGAGTSLHFKQTINFAQKKVHLITYQAGNLIVL